MKRMLFTLSGLLLLIVLVCAWLLFGSGTSFNEKSKPLYVYTGKATKQAVLQALEEGDFLKRPSIFSMVANQLDVWARLKPGKYDIKNGTSIVGIAKMLRNNQQTPVKLVINKLRTIENLAHLIGKNFEADSTEVMSFLQNTDSLSKFDVDTNTAMTLVIPNT
ncbi:MAG: endolytic transglycosylase MltG, partial [Chitinophagaceae bacterium]|nr:endolytic transglycosylase MltG [Chitinophagaceae bacterium]